MIRKALFFMLVLLSSAGNAQPTFPTDADWTAVTKGGVAITDRGIVFGDLAGNLYAYAIPPDAPVRGRAASH